jgi:hypothetical protein
MIANGCQKKHTLQFTFFSQTELSPIFVQPVVLHCQNHRMYWSTVYEYKDLAKTKKNETGATGSAKGP